VPRLQDRAEVTLKAKDFRDQDALLRLQTANRELSRRLADAKVRTTDLVGAVYRAARDAALMVDLPPVKAPRLGTSKAVAETAIAVLSDWQLGKKTTSYNTDICEQRIARYAERLAKLTDIQRAAHPVRDLRVYLLGDLVEGELIFPGQEHAIDTSLFLQVMTNGPRILGGFLRAALAVFERVHVVSVIGNHGALGGPVRRSYHPESNADAMMYEATRQQLRAESRLTWAPTLKPGERSWYAVDRIGQHGFLLFHGDQIKGGFAGFPWYGFDRKVKGWRMGAVKEPFTYAVSGHFHTPVRMLIGNVRLWGNGSTESDNTYAAERLAAQGTPSQWLLFAEPQRGVTCEYEVHLT